MKNSYSVIFELNARRESLAADLETLENALLSKSLIEGRVKVLFKYLRVFINSWYDWPSYSMHLISQKDAIFIFMSLFSLRYHSKKLLKIP